MPLIFILYMFRVPYIDRFVRPAVSKFIFDVASYLVFLGVIFLNSALDRDHTRGAPPTDLEVIVLIYVFGFTWRFVRQTLRRRGQFCGNYNVYNTTWQSYELFMLLLFWCYFLLKIGLWVEMEVTHNLVPTADRRRWLWYDPFLWCEAVYACACTLAVAQVYSFFKVGFRTRWTSHWLLVSAPPPEIQVLLFMQGFPLNLRNMCYRMPNQWQCQYKNIAKCDRDQSVRIDDVGARCSQ